VLEAAALYLSSYITASVLKSALAYSIVGPWRAWLVKLGLNTAVIEAEIVAGGAAMAADIVKRKISSCTVKKRKQIKAITRTQKSNASSISNKRGMVLRAR
jgi:hypothetical protein